MTTDWNELLKGMPEPPKAADAPKSGGLKDDVAQAAEAAMAARRVFLDAGVSEELATGASLMWHAQLWKSLFDARACGCLDGGEDDE